MNSSSSMSISMKDQNTADDASDDASVVGTGIYVTEVGPDDVLLGRGTGPCTNEGNVSFRNAVEAIKLDYISTPSRKMKNNLVHKTIEAIKAKKGRFLNKLRKSEMKTRGIFSNKIVYEIVHDDVAFEKTKQAIRYVHYKRDVKLGLRRTTSFHAGKNQDEAQERHQRSSDLVQQEQILAMARSGNEYSRLSWYAPFTAVQPQNLIVGRAITPQATPELHGATGGIVPMVERLPLGGSKFGGTNGVHKDISEAQLAQIILLQSNSSTQGVRNPRHEQGMLFGSNLSALASCNLATSPKKHGYIDFLGNMRGGLEEPNNAIICHLLGRGRNVPPLGNAVGHLEKQDLYKSLLMQQKVGIFPENSFRPPSVPNDLLRSTLRLRNTHQHNAISGSPMSLPPKLPSSLHLNKTSGNSGHPSATI